MFRLGRGISDAMDLGLCCRAGVSLSFHSIQRFPGRHPKIHPIAIEWDHSQIAFGSDCVNVLLAFRLGGIAFPQSFWEIREPLRFSYWQAGFGQSVLAGWI